MHRTPGQQTTHHPREGRREIELLVAERNRRSDARSLLGVPGDAVGCSRSQAPEPLVRRPPIASGRLGWTLEWALRRRRSPLPQPLRPTVRCLSCDGLPQHSCGPVDRSETLERQGPLRDAFSPCASIESMFTEWPFASNLAVMQLGTARLHPESESEQVTSVDTAHYGRHAALEHWPAYITWVRTQSTPWMSSLPLGAAES